MLGYFQATLSRVKKSIYLTRNLNSVTSSRLRNINLIPIDYGKHHHLRGRLTLRGQP